MPIVCIYYVIYIIGSWVMKVRHLEYSELSDQIKYEITKLKITKVQSVNEYFKFSRWKWLCQEQKRQGIL